MPRSWCSGLITRANMLTCLLGLEPDKGNVALAHAVHRLLQATLNPMVFMYQKERDWTPYGRWTRQVADVYDRLAEIIERRRAEEPRPDALSILCHTTDENGDSLTTPEIAGELHGLFAAGFETTAMSMMWALLTILGTVAADNVIRAGRGLVLVPLAYVRLEWEKEVESGMMIDCVSSAGLSHCHERLRCFALLPVGDRDKDAEILALRHQIAVLERQLGAETRVRFALSTVLPARVRRVITSSPFHRRDQNGATVEKPRRRLGRLGRPLTLGPAASGAADPGGLRYWCSVDRLSGLT